MRGSYLFVGASLLFCSVSFANAQTSENKNSSSAKLPETVVTANRYEVPLEETASSITVIGPEQIALRKQQNVLELLRDVPGLDVVRAGGPGGNTSIFLRGANSEHTLVLLDGIEMNNPIGPGRAFNFADITLDNVERIEVLRGAQSSLYGSDALGGVINIITKKGKEGSHGFLGFEAGAYDTLIERAGVSGANDIAAYSIGLSRQDTGGVSAADARDGNSENDRYGNTSGDARIDVTPSKQFSANIFARMHDSTNDLDNAGGLRGDDPNRKLRTKQYFLRGAANTSFFEDALKQTLGISYTNHHYQDNNDFDPQNPSDRLRSAYDGSLLKFDFQNSVDLDGLGRIVGGLETEEERGDSQFNSESSFGPFELNFDERSVRTNGGYLQYEGKIQDWFISTLSGRVDDHSVFGSQETWKIAPLIRIAATGTRLRAAAGTGFKAPSLFQLYSSFGNKDLQPERAKSYEVGFDQELLPGIFTVGATLFRNEFTQLITFNPSTFISENIAEATTEGWEGYLEAHPLEQLVLKTNYTFTQATDDITGSRLLRRPRHKANIDLTYEVAEGTQCGANILLVGRRADSDFSSFPAKTVDLGGYTVVNLFAKHQLTDVIELYGRADNLFDKEYQEVLGYGTLGMGAYAGIGATF